MRSLKLIGVWICYSLIIQFMWVIPVFVGTLHGISWIILTACWGVQINSDTAAWIIAFTILATWILIIYLDNKYRYLDKIWRRLFSRL
jgi:hypothetical protein